MPVHQRTPRLATACPLALVTAVVVAVSWVGQLEAKVDRLPRQGGVDPADLADRPVAPRTSHR